jgi:hypothetical protein
VELSTLTRSLSLQTKDLAGQLFLSWKGTGKGLSLAAVEGVGEVQVRGGRILELPFLGAFAELLKIPTLQSIIFQEADGPFTIGHGTLQTSSFQMRAPQVTLTIVGSGGFLKAADSPIDWRIYPTLSAELIPEESRSTVGKAIAKGTSYLVGEGRISGTWRNPKRQFLSKPVTQLLNEQLFNLQDILKDLF